MEKESKVMESDVKVEKKNLFVVREKFVGSNGQEYWSYFVKGKVRERIVRVDFAPKDKGGYEPLDILFDVQDKAELIITDETSTDMNGNKLSYKSYLLRTTDEDGETYECNVKPARDSDKSLLTMLLKQLAKQNAK